MDKMTFFPSYLEAVEELEDIARQGLFVLSIVRYGLRGEEPKFDDESMRVGFKLIKPVIDKYRSEAQRKKQQNGKSTEYPQKIHGKKRNALMIRIWKRI